MEKQIGRQDFGFLNGSICDPFVEVFLTTCAAGKSPRLASHSQQRAHDTLGPRLQPGTTKFTLLYCACLLTHTRLFLLLDDWPPRERAKGFFSQYSTLLSTTFPPSLPA